jgi:hypothetical protein
MQPALQTTMIFCMVVVGWRGEQQPDTSLAQPRGAGTPSSTHVVINLNHFLEHCQSPQDQTASQALRNRAERATRYTLWPKRTLGGPTQQPYPRCNDDNATTASPQQGNQTKPIIPPGCHQSSYLHPTWPCPGGGANNQPKVAANKHSRWPNHLSPPWTLCISGYTLTYKVPSLP